jgi:amino acid permease
MVEHAPKRSLAARVTVHVGALVKGGIGTKYSATTGTFFALNMVLGTGPLTLPYAFAQAGFALSALFLAICAGFAYISATYIMEALVTGNACIYKRGLEVALLDGEDPSSLQDLLDGEDPEAMQHLFKLRERIELGEMGSRVLPRFAAASLYWVLFLYTFGCLCVYAVSMTQTLAAFVPDVPQNAFVIVLAVILWPLCSADVQKLRSLQYGIMVLRAVAIAGMIWLAASQPAIAQQPPQVQPLGLPVLFGNAVLSFMVHHSLPGLISPLEDQLDGPKVLRNAYAISYVLYLVLGYTGLRAFGYGINPLYSLNFDAPALKSYPLLMLAIYPIVAITLRNNVLAFCSLGNEGAVGILATTAVAVLPCAVAAITSDVQAVVAIFSGYFGLTLMLLFPPFLALRSRAFLEANTDHLTGSHTFKFPLRSGCLRSPIIAVFMIFWFGAIVFNTYRLFF